MEPTLSTEIQVGGDGVGEEERKLTASVRVIVATSVRSGYGGRKLGAGYGCTMYNVCITWRELESRNIKTIITIKQTR